MIIWIIGGFVLVALVQVSYGRLQQWRQKAKEDKSGKDELLDQ